MIVSAKNTPHQDQVSGTSSILPPLIPVVLLLRLLIVKYLKTCTSPLVNPIIGNYVRPPTPVDDEFPSASLPLGAGSFTHITDSPVKSENKNDFNLENILKSSAKTRTYSVMVEKLSMDDINQWTGHVPHWSKIDPYSSLSEVDSDMNNK